MKRLRTTLFALLAVSCGSFAKAAEDDSQDKATLSSSQAFIGGDQFEVEFTAVDGKNISRRDYIQLKPGRYIITARVPAQFTTSQINRFRETYDDYVDFEVLLEPGQSYAMYGIWNRLERDNPYELVLSVIE